jgi:hypothetical protein
VEAYSAMLADCVAIGTDRGISAIADAIETAAAVDGIPPRSPPSIDDQVAELRRQMIATDSERELRRILHGVDALIALEPPHVQAKLLRDDLLRLLSRYRFRRFRRTAELLVSAVAFFILLFLLFSALPSPPQRSGDATAAFAVTAPRESERVGLRVEVRGRTPFTTLRHYIVVTPLATGDVWVQTSPVTSVTPGGTFLGLAQLGTASDGGEQRFTIQVLATRSVLRAGPLVVVPSDARFSPPVTVIRNP